jgi:hypothetical protein
VHLPVCDNGRDGFLLLQSFSAESESLCRKTTFCYSLLYRSDVIVIQHYGQYFIRVICIHLPLFNIHQFIEKRSNRFNTIAAINICLELKSCHDAYSILIDFNRKLFNTTDTELKAIAPPAIMGLSKIPNAG